MSWDHKNRTLEAFHEGVCVACDRAIYPGQVIQKCGRQWTHFNPDECTDPRYVKCIGEGVKGTHTYKVTAEDGRIFYRWSDDTSSFLTSGRRELFLDRVWPYGVEHQETAKAEAERQLALLREAKGE